jgi:hypothetical protein
MERYMEPKDVPRHGPGGLRKFLMVISGIGDQQLVIPSIAPFSRHQDN